MVKLVPVDHNPFDDRDYTNRYNTDLGDKEPEFQDWLSKQPKDAPTSTYDYDLRGWYAENQGKNLGEGHLTDTYKKPNHTTFSDQSKYNGADGAEGGHWDNPDPNNPDFSTFVPGSTNMYKPDELREYFNQYEKGNVLLLPTDVEPM